MSVVLAHGFTNRDLFLLLVFLCSIGLLGASATAGVMLAIWKGTFKSLKGYGRCFCVSTLAILGATIGFSSVASLSSAAGYAGYAVSMGSFIIGSGLFSWFLARLILRAPAVKALAASMPVTLIAAVVLWSAQPPEEWDARREMVQDLDCMGSMSNLSSAIRRYREQFQADPPDLESLARSGILRNNVSGGEEGIRCPGGSRDKPFTHFYFADQENQADDALILCEYRENHPDYRRVLRRNGDVDRLSEQEFQDELAKPVNQKFAAALRAVEAQP